MAFLKGHTPWNTGLTKASHPSLVAAAEKLMGRTAATHPHIATRAEKMRGRTKHNNAGYMAVSEKLMGRIAATDPSKAAMVEKLTGRTKTTHPYLAVAGQKTGDKLRGRTMATHSDIAIRAEKRRGKTKETDAGYAATADKLRGRTIMTHPEIAIRAEKMRGRTKENSLGCAAQANKLRGRTAVTHPYLATIGQKTGNRLRGRTAATHPYLAIKADKQRGNKNWNWRGGKSLKPYASTWNNGLRESIRQRDGYKCQGCGIPQAECIIKLDVHHIDYDKKNCIPINLVSLCHKCNSKVNINRDFWQAHFEKIMVARGLRPRFPTRPK